MKAKKTLVPDYIKNLKTYQAGKPIEELAREKKLEHISKLASNENPLGPSPFAIKEMTSKLWDLHRYPDMHAYKLKMKLCELYEVKPDNIILGNGSEGIMAYIARAFLQPGDEVLTSENTFIGFYILARSVGAKLVTAPLTKDYRYDIEAITERITEKTKVIYIANPNNPTGTYITKGEFDYMMDHVPEHCIVILDEAYFEFAIRAAANYPDSMDYRYDNVITLRTFSKAYGLAGIRCGYGFAHKDFISNLKKVKLPFEPNALAQVGALGAVVDQPHLKRTLKENERLYKTTMTFLKEKNFKAIDSVTNFITYKTGSDEASEWMFQHLLDRGVIIRHLKSNEMPEYVRVSIGTREEMDHYFEAMEEILPQYDKLFGRVK
ncbi:MAG: histidinol-phosphate transaminase [Halobacteriovoraceae bacterium]|nr:histidinol-phosphate transaminase [Halobacteriovoraceae bacterium]